jgi:two-component system chemotaxis response regulator CheB
MDTDGILRYRCRIGHAYTARMLLEGQDESLENALWAGVRAMEERMNLLRKLAEDARSAGFNGTAEKYEERARLSLEHARVLRELLLEVRGAGNNPELSGP